jgi:hypothetical protein
MIGSRPNGWSRIGNFLLWWTRVRTTAVRRPDGDIWIVILALRRRASRRDTTSSRRLIDLPFIGIWKESETVRVLRGVRTCCWNVRTDASWIEPSRHSGGSGRRDTSSGRMMLGLSGVQTVWHVVRTDGTVTDGSPDVMALSSGRLTGNWKSSDSEVLLNSRIPVKHLYTQVILSETQNEAKILTVCLLVDFVYGSCCMWQLYYESDCWYVFNSYIDVLNR